MSSQYKTVQELAENGHLQAIPGEFIVPEEERCNLKDGLNFSTPTTALELPLIDMDMVVEDELAAGVDRHSELLQQIRTACVEWGFFQVKNHGVPLALMKQMQQVVHQFLELPLEEKNKWRFTSPEGFNGEEGYSSRHAMIEGGISMWSDRLRCHMFPMSTWKCDLWPKNPSRFREVAEHYSEEQNKLAKKLLELISESLGLEPSYINEYLSEDCVQNLQVNYYPSCPQPELALGLVKHSDPSAVTLLLQDTNSGLQVLKDGEWITVKPIEGAFVVNLGDQVEVATNGKYKSIEHRAFVSSQPRLSIATFTSPADKSIVGPIPEFWLQRSFPSTYNVPTVNTRNHFMNHTWEVGVREHLAKTICTLSWLSRARSYFKLICQVHHETGMKQASLLDVSSLPDKSAPCRDRLKKKVRYNR